MGQLASIEMKFEKRILARTDIKTIGMVVGVLLIHCHIGAANDAGGSADGVAIAFASTKSV